MFWLRNKKVIFVVHTLNLRPVYTTALSKPGFVFKLDNLKNKEGHAFRAMQYMSPLPYYRKPPPSPHGVDDQILYMTHIHAIGNNHVKYK